MRIVCPSCSAVYEIPDGMLAAGQNVRCARCTGQWQPIEAAPGALTDPAEMVAAGKAPVQTATTEPRLPEPRELPVETRPRSEPRLSPEPRLPERPRVPAWPREGREARGTLDETDNEWGALAIDRLMGERPRSPGKSVGLQLAWVLSVIVLAVGLAAAYGWRDEVMTAWPAATRLYAALGLAQ